MQTPSISGGGSAIANAGASFPAATSANRPALGKYPTVLADDGTHQIVSAPYPVFIAGKKARFFRVSVSLGP